MFTVGSVSTLLGVIVFIRTEINAGMMSQSAYVYAGVINARHLGLPTPFSISTTSCASPPERLIVYSWVFLSVFHGGGEEQELPPVWAPSWVVV